MYESANIRRYYNVMKKPSEFKAEFFKALANPIRIQIIDALRDDEHTVNHLREILNIEGPNVSQQLAILRANNIVSTRKERSNVFYSIKDPTIFKLLDIAKVIFNNQLAGIRDLLSKINKKKVGRKIKNYVRSLIAQIFVPYLCTWGDIGIPYLYQIEESFNCCI